MNREVLNIVSKLKNIPSAELEVKIYENTKKIFPKIFNNKENP